MRFAASLATLAAGAALALVIAYWGWQLLGPSAVHIAPAAPLNPAATIVAANLFGQGDQQRPPQPVTRDAVLAGDTKLLGIIAESGDRGYALFRTATGAKLVAQGSEIDSGVTLVSVQRDGVTIRDGAGEHRYALRTSAPAAARTAATASSVNAARAAVTARANATCAPPAGFRGSVVKLNAELLGGLGADAVQWPALLEPITGGLVVRADNGFAAMLGLKTGDRLAQANGIALTAPDDVATAIIKPLVANQGVRLIGARDGATQELWLANVACAG
jgi:type II secretory pathway component PulC